MAELGEPRSRAKAWAAELDAARRRAGLMTPEWLSAPAGRLRGIVGEWALLELAPGRLMPWLSVAFGFGIVLYFSAGREPAWWAACVLALASVTLTFLARRRPVAFASALGFAAIAVGFAVATLTTLHDAHPVLDYPTWSAHVTGFVESREERAKSDRIVVHVQSITAQRMAVKPARVRVAVRKGTAPPVGSFVAFKAHLAPPPQPSRPGGYDFARAMYFQGIGASGFALGRIKTEPASHPGSFRLRAAAFISGIREAIDHRIHNVLPGDRGSIASALITGMADAISPKVNNAFYVSSLGHVLSISGYHMAVVAGIVFFFIRAGLALVTTLALRRPIKKWAAAAALVTTAFYLVLSGAAVATQRSFIMIAVVLIGVMADRPVLTFRTLTIAALGVLALAPQAVVNPSFQMSFAATLALIAAYQYGLLWPAANRDTALGARVALWGMREIVGLVLASLVAGSATMLYVAYHFHRLAPYGVLANLLAMPVVSVWVMPMGILGLLTLPLGFDAPFWQMMGHGIDWMNAVAFWVTSLPGSVGHVRAFGTGPLLLGTAGLLLICLLRTPLRWSGAVLALLACLWAFNAPRPDVLVTDDGRMAAIRGPDGQLVVLAGGRDTFALKEWLAADGDGRDVTDKTLHAGVTCDAVGCISHFPDGRLASYVKAIETFAEDCTQAAVVVSVRQAQRPCAATLVDRKVWHAHGAVALYPQSDGFSASFARPAGYERPWARALPEVALHPASLRDATPKPDDLEAGD